MSYKGYELSSSLNGKDIVHIARNKGGAVIFRETSEVRLKKAIDIALEQKEKAAEEALKAKEAKVKKAKTRDLFQAKDEYAEEVKEAEEAKKEIEENKETLLPPTQNVARGPGGRFVSKKSQTGDADQKKSFWDRLK